MLDNCACESAGGAGGVFELEWLLKNADYAVLATDLNTGALVIGVDATAGQVTITVSPTLGTASGTPLLTVLKTDITNNPVLLSNGVAPIDAIVTPASADGQIGGWRTVYANGVALRSVGVG